MKRGETQTITTPTLAAINQVPQAFALRVLSGRVQVRGGWVHGAEEGTADIVGGFYGRVFAVETKTPEGRFTDAQIRFLERIEAQGGIAIRGQNKTPADVVAELMRCCGVRGR